LWLYTTDLRPRATECPKLLPPNFRVTSSSDVRALPASPTGRAFARRA